MRVVLADDATLFREGLARILAEAGFEVAGQAGDAEDLLRKVGAHKPDVAVVDVRMPPSHTDEGLRAARSPSSVCVGGMRTSMTATSGLCAPTLRSRSSASPAWPATSKPESSSRRHRPSRNSTESSATTTFNGVSAVLIRGSPLGE